MKYLALILLLVCGTAHAQTRSTPCSPTTPNNAICVYGEAPTTFDDGTPIVVALTYRVERRAGTTGSYANVATGLSQPRYYDQNLAPGEYFYRLYANCTICTRESLPSNAVNREATPNPKVPNAPVIIIAATIHADGPPTYRIIQRVTLKPNEVVLVAPESMRPLFANR